jgi:hypothetical protein
MLDMQFASGRLDYRSENRAMKSISVPVLNSLVFIRDAESHNFPDIDGLSSYWATESCVAVSCLPDSEGETTISLASGSEVTRQSTALFDGEINTPSYGIVVDTVLGGKLFSASGLTAKTRLRIWTNGHRATDTIAIALD